MQASFRLLVKVLKRSFSDDLLQFPEAVNRLIEEVESWNKNSLLDVYANDVVSRQLSAGEIRSISDNELFDIGSHTIKHARLTHLTDRDMEEELLVSRNILEDVTGKRCVSICYPDGSYDSRVSAMASRCGYETGFTSVERSNRAGVNPLEMTRYNLSAGFSESELLCKASGMFDGLFDVQQGEYRDG